MNVAGLAILALVMSGGPAENDFAPARDAFCGARCVHRVLQLYQRNEELTDLIVEFRGGESSGEVPFPELAQALERRGIHSKFVKLGALDILSWKHPAILHVDGNHFVVLESTGPATATIWDGPGGVTEVPLWELNWRSSRIVLLTSDVPITEEAYARRELRYAALALGTVLLALGAIQARRWRRIRASVARRDGGMWATGSPRPASPGGKEVVCPPT